MIAQQSLYQWGYLHSTNVIYFLKENILLLDEKRHLLKPKTQDLRLYKHIHSSTNLNKASLSILGEHQYFGRELYDTFSYCIASYLCKRKI